MPRLHICFNPRPPRGTGASADCGFSDLHFIVSILARLVGRALQHVTLKAPGRPAVSILARLVGRALLTLFITVSFQQVRILIIRTYFS